jgi:hypothetical protein
MLCHGHSSLRLFAVVLLLGGILLPSLALSEIRAQDPAAPAVPPPPGAAPAGMPPDAAMPMPGAEGMPPAAGMPGQQAVPGQAAAPAPAPAPAALSPQDAAKTFLISSSGGMPWQIGAMFTAFWVLMAAEIAILSKHSKRLDKPKKRQNVEAE